ncbi:MAG: PstS family phosphate ABC transporter substrate-binding protein [Pirellulaceae bacterium]
MNYRFNRYSPFAFCVAACLLLCGCDSSKQAGPTASDGAAVGEVASNGDVAPGGEAGPVSELAGKIAVEGSSTVAPITNQAKERFNEHYPDVEISVSGDGTSNGFASFVKKQTDISDASRPIKQKELDQAQANSVTFVEVPVAYDGLTIAVNPKNDFVKSLTVDQLAKIFRAGDEAKTWKDVNPEWPEEKISIFSPGTGSGTYDYFSEVVLGKDGTLRSDNQINLNEDDNILVRGVAGDPFAIGYFGYSYYERNMDDLRAVPIVNPAGNEVSPTKATIESGEYAPFSRPLFIYLNTESLDKAEVETFVDFYMENIREVVTAANYVPLPDEIYAKAVDNVANRVTGTHYLTEEGEKREGPLSEVYQPANLKK